MDPSVPDDEPVPYGVKEEILTLGVGGPWPGLNEAHRAWVLNHGGQENLSWRELRALLLRVPADGVTADINEAQIAMIVGNVTAGLARPEGSGPQQHPVAHSQPTATDTSSALRPRSSNNRPPSSQTPRANAQASVSSRERWSAEDDRRLIALEQQVRSWKKISSHFPGRTSAACRQRIIVIVGSRSRAARRPHAIANCSAVARQTAVSGDHPIPTMPRASIASSSQFLAVLSPARRIPHSTFHEAGTADLSLRLPELASPASMRTSQRLPSIRDLDLPTLPALSSQPAVNSLQQGRLPGITNPPVYTRPQPPLLSASRRQPPRPMQLTQNPTNLSTRQDSPDLTLISHGNTSIGQPLAGADRLEGSTSSSYQIANASRPVPNLMTASPASTTQRLPTHGPFPHPLYPSSSSYQTISAYGQRGSSGLTFPASGRNTQRASTDRSRSPPLPASTALQTSNVPRRRHAPWFTAWPTQNDPQRQESATTIDQHEQNNPFFDDLERFRREQFERSGDLGGGYGGSYDGGN